MSQTIEYGYLNTNYMTYNYLSGVIEEYLSMQVEMKINASQNLNTQVDMKTDGAKNLGTQVDQYIVSEADDFHLGTQVEMKIADQLENLGVQVDMKTDGAKHLGTQVDMRIENHLQRFGFQVRFGVLAHYICDGYLAESNYLTRPYLTDRFCAHQFTQVEMRIESENDDKHLGTQVEMRIEDELKNLGTQVEMRIEDELKRILTQVEMLSSSKLNTQVTMVIYNNTQMRILCDFASRGTEALGGLNWSSVQAIAAGDYSVNNLNTDIIEQITKTDGIIALWQLRCDTGNPNTFVDTIGILNHNFTRSARVEVSGSDDAAFSTIKFSFVMETELENMYYVAETLPNIPARYYQFTIQDASNSAGFLSIGTIVFGSAIILTRKEQFVNPVTFGKRHYKDSLATEGFTSVSNDRALRRFLNLSFTQLIMDGGNFRLLKEYMSMAKTDLKCLVIPVPTKASRLAVFSKLSQLPEEQHNAVDDQEWRVDMTFDWDESL